MSACKITTSEEQATVEQGTAPRSRSGRDADHREHQQRPRPRPTATPCSPAAGTPSACSRPTSRWARSAAADGAAVGVRADRAGRRRAPTSRTVAFVRVILVCPRRRDGARCAGERILDQPWVRGPMVVSGAAGAADVVPRRRSHRGASADIMLGLGYRRRTGGRPGAGRAGGFPRRDPVRPGAHHAVRAVGARLHARRRGSSPSCTDRLLRHVWWFTMLVGMGASALGVLLYATVGASCSASTRSSRWHLVTDRRRGRHRERPAHAARPCASALDV